MVWHAIEQLTANIRAFGRYWEPDELMAATVDDATKLTHVPSKDQNFLTVDSRAIAKYISSEFGEIHDCYKVKIGEDSTAYLLCTPTIGIAYT